MPSGPVVAHGIRRSAASLLSIRPLSSEVAFTRGSRRLQTVVGAQRSRSTIRTSHASTSTSTPLSSTLARSTPSPPPPPSSSTTRRRTMATTTPAANGTTTTTDPAAPNNTSGVTGPALEQKLTAALEASHVHVEDISGGCGQSFAATIVSAKFEGKMALARHRLVNAAVRDEVGQIHAWTPKCLTPAEWAKKQAQG